MFRRFAIVASILASSAILAVQADEPAKPAAPAVQKPTGAGNDASGDQFMVAAHYRQLEETLLRIAQKMERSGNAEGVRKARVILKALDEARRKQIAVNLGQLAEDLKKPGLNELKKSIDRGAGVKNDLEQILTLLLSDGENEKNKDREMLKALIQELDKAIRDQKVAQAQNMSGQVDKAQAAKAQDIASAQAKKTLDKIKEYEAAKKANQTKNGDQQDNQGKDGKDGKDGKGDKKDGKDGKQDGKDNKDGKDGKDGKGDKKDGKDDKKDNKDGKGEPKDNKGDQKDGKGEPKDGKGEPKDGKGEPKDGKGEPKDGKGEPKDSKGQPKNGQPNQGQTNEGDSKDNKSNDDQQDQQDVTPSREKVQDAKDYQKKAEDKINKDKRPEAVPDQEEARKKLEEAKKKLEEILRQMREEEQERILADLQRRCEKMLQLQEIVYDGTQKVDQKIQKTPDKKASREEEVASGRLGDKEDEIVAEADKAIAVIETEGSAVAFAEVFHQVRNDMAHVSKRLHRSDVGPETQLIEQDVITMLKEMIEALKKARSDQQNKNQPGQSGEPPPPGLIDLLAEMRLIRSMQLMVNNRTAVWGKRYQGEQAQPPEIVTELKDLAHRQDRIYQIMSNLAKGKNQ